MDKIVGLKNIEMSLNVSQVLDTLIKVASRTQDKEGLLAIISNLSMRELEVFKIEAQLRVRIMEVVSRFHLQRIQEYRETLKKQLFCSFLRRLEVERKAMEFATNDAKTFVEILSGNERVELLQGGRKALMEGVKELLRLFKSNAVNLDVNQMAGNIKNAIQ